jgi:glycosyltransferase involved in cell wall biosynthesis
MEVLILSYILVTPAKTEEDNLPKLIQSVAEQTINPLVWVIVDDGSTDDTPGIIREAKEKYNWIQSVHLEEHPRDLSKHYAYVCNVGFDFAIKYCKANNLQYDYIGLLDADMILGSELFDKLIKEFKKNPKLGIASGSVYYEVNNKLIIQNDRDSLPLGGIRLWRRECFEETGGYLLSYSTDAVSNVLAKLRGWETRRFEEIRAVQTRRTSSAEGLWKGYKYHGESAYFRNYHPLFVLAKGLKLSFESPYYIGIAYLYGYFSSVLRRMDKIDNNEVSDYYYYQKHKEVIEYYKNKLRSKLRIVNKRE